MVLLILAACEVTPTSPEMLNRAQLLLLGKRRDLSALRRIVLALARNGGKADFAGWNRLFFERANFNHPFAAAAIYYNDEAGIRAMAGAIAWERRSLFCRIRPRRW